MAQSPGDHNSRGPKITTKLYKKSFPWGKIVWARALTFWGLVTCHGLRVSQGAMCSDDGGSCGRQRGHDLAQLKLSNFLMLFIYFRVAYSLAPAKKEAVPPRRRLNSALSSRDAWPVPLSHWFPRSDVDPRELGPGQLTQAPEPRANPQGKDNPLSWYRTKIIL